jgi:hypothetical protein
MAEKRQLSLIKGEQRFLFRYEPGQEEEMLDSFVSLANDRSSTFDWFDAAVLSFQLSKRLVEEADALLAPRGGRGRHEARHGSQAGWGPY